MKNVFIKRNNGIHSVQQGEVLEIRAFLLTVGWDESGKAILNENTIRPSTLH